MATKKRKAPRRHYSKTKAKASRQTALRRGTVVLFLALLIAGLLYGLYRGATYTASLFLSRNPHFELRRIDITSDGRLTRTQLREYAGIQPGINLFEVDLDALSRSLEEIPLIESVTLRRNLPDALEIRVTERTAVAQIQWTPRGVPFLIDRHGIVLPATRSGRSLPLIEGLPLDQLQPGIRLTDPGVRHCLKLILAAEELGFGPQVRFGSFNLRYPDHITVQVNDQTTARFPHHSAKEKLIRLVSVLQLAAEQNRRVQTVDLTPDGRNVPVTFFK
jgi:cell division protein FtsQ